MATTTTKAKTEPVSWAYRSEKVVKKMPLDEQEVYYSGMEKYGAQKLQEVIEKKQKEREELAKKIGMIILGECPDIGDDLTEVRRFAEKYSSLDRPIGSSDGDAGKANSTNLDNDAAGENDQTGSGTGQEAGPIGTDNVAGNESKSPLHNKVLDPEEVKEIISGRRPLAPNGTPIQGGRGAKSPKTVSVSGRKNVQSDSGTDRDRKPNGTASRNDNDAKTPSAMEVYGVKNVQSDISSQQSGVPIGTSAGDGSESDWTPSFNQSKTKPTVPFPT